ncbi:MAG TPA: class I SAM-dependent methyltransferase, partial [Thiothrix sp.]|nr:class I SAM-dependent methyltransferase [Thiothrix sp.]
MTSYNAIPYESLPISYTYVPFLAALGRLYGLETPDPSACRVLELGCAEGSNIVPMAYYFPNSEFVGIDLSEVQIASGQAHIDALELSNITLYVDDLAQMRASDYGKFDYIIVHGVFSWVPPAVQQRILQLGKALLTEQGMMYISYNTYPGWHQHMV